MSKRLLIAALCGLFVAMSSLAQANNHAERPPAQVIVAPVAQETWSRTVSSVGELYANESTTITSAVTDKISHIQFQDNQRVREGQVLVSLTNRIIKAPFSGVLGLREVSVGQLLQPGDTVTTLDDDSAMKLKFSIPSVYLSELKKGLPVAATSPAFLDETFQGKVFAIDSRVNRDTRSINLLAKIPNPNRILRSGLFMSVIMEMEPREALVVPESAVFPKAGKQWVWLVNDDNKVSARSVSLGVRANGKVEITQGVSLGEYVVTHGLVKMREGALVVIRGDESGEQDWQTMIQSDKSNKPTP